jgi:hypothetical protein
MKGYVCVLYNISITGLDFHTVPDSMAPHSHRHPHWVPHPSRWSIDLLLVAVECLSLPSGWWLMILTTWGRELCEHALFSLLFLASETFFLLSRSLHLRWLLPGFQVFFAGSGISTMGGSQNLFLFMFKPFCLVYLCLSVFHRNSQYLGWAWSRCQVWMGVTNAAICMNPY